MLPYLGRMAWSIHEERWRIYAAFVALAITKGVSLYVPVLFKEAIDALTGTAVVGVGVGVGAGVGYAPEAVAACLTALAWSGVAKVVSGLAKEYQMVVFTPMAQGVGRQVMNEWSWRDL